MKYYMKYIKKVKKITLLLCLLAIIFLVGCTSNEKKKITVYYIANDNANYAFESRDIEVTSNDTLELLNKVKDALLEGLPNGKEEYKNLYNNIAKISFVTLENKVLVVNLDGDYYALNLAEKLALKTGIAKSYSSFKFIDKIRFLQKGQVIVDENGKEEKDLKIEDLITEMDMGKNKFTSNIATYNLYFSSADGKMLYREERALEVQTSVLLAKELVEELIKGPSVDGLLDTIPKQTRLRQLELKDGICYVDFNKDFKMKHSGDKNAETLTIYSIVNTLTELPEIEKVQFLIDGEKNGVYQGNYEFDMPFTRNSALIYTSAPQMQEAKQKYNNKEQKNQKTDTLGKLNLNKIHPKLEEVDTKKKEENVNVQSNGNKDKEKSDDTNTLITTNAIKDNSNSEKEDINSIIVIKDKK